jgi:hypothetical protein
MDAYGGIQISEGSIQALANQIKLGQIPMRMNHDPRLTLGAQIVDSFTVRGGDGHLSAHVIFDVDQEEWERTGAATAGGFSVSIVERFLGTNSETPAIKLAADAHWFTDEQLVAAFERLTRVGAPVQCGHLFQFSADPPALIAVTFLLQQLNTISTGLLCNYLYDGLKHLVGERTKPSKLQLKFDRETGKVTDAYLETASDAVMKHAIDKLPAILDQTGNFEYSEVEEDWKQRLP